MKPILITASIAIIIGAFGGWMARYYADGHHGIQWQFNDAASRGDLNEMKRLMSKGANPLVAPFCGDAIGYGAAPLFEAASSGEVEAVKLLIGQGADVNLIEGTDTPLDAAEYRKAKVEKTIEVLRAHKAQTLYELSKKVAEKTEQPAAGQPATRAESKPEGDQKPQPESEGRSR